MKRIAFFGSSIVSAYWNGAATYYRGIIKGLYKLGYGITFYEPDAFDRQKHRDLQDDPEYAEVVVYPSDPETARMLVAKAAEEHDILVKNSGVGVLDEDLTRYIARYGEDCISIYWDVDAPATLQLMETDGDHYMNKLLPSFDLIFTYGGGDPVVERFTALGGPETIPVYNALDPDTHFPVEPVVEFTADLNFLGNRLPDREARVEEFFFKPARSLSEKRFIIGGSGWEQPALPSNVRHVGHVYTGQHNAFNCSPMAVLNISRESMASNGFSPATRVFEAAGAAACLITDHWEGIKHFLHPGEEVLVARDGKEVVEILQNLSKDRAQEIGRAARDRVLRDHTYTQRAQNVHQILTGLFEKVEINSL